ncbi:chemotaxis protein CheD [Ideonella sp. DXS29W]|uniref:Probable chemoreceptor glutamine deamidase CheD n=1 Tax=Ideonella lacteola TaxID=2984193 RepID=A0ABU9BUT7_9BURK
MPTSKSGSAPNARPSTPAPEAHRLGGEKLARAGEALFLMPGEWYFGREAMSVRTLLGSCVAVTLWHPVKQMGGMCHYLLPERRGPAGAPDGRYGIEAIELLVQRLKRAGTQPDEYVAHLYGGADTMPDATGVKLNVGERNIETGWTLIDKYGFQLDGVDVGDHIPRNVTLHLASGEVHVKRGTRHQTPQGE